MKVTLVLSMILIVLAPASLRAEVPLTINHQGYLTSDAGAPVTGTRSMTFAIYNVVVAGAALWTETQSVLVTNGVFNVYLGDAAALPDSIFDGQELYLGVKVGTDSEMTPRIRLTTVPYAFASGRDALQALKWFRDADGDGFGNLNVWQFSRSQPDGYVADSTDCNDAASAIHPGAPETCDGVDSDCNLLDGYPETCNGIDDDCNGITDDNMVGPLCPLRQGVCMGSRLHCLGAEGWQGCAPPDYGPNYQTVEDRCDGLDNDCDGMTDENSNCNDGLACTIDQCNGVGGCSHSILPDNCVIGGLCYSTGDVNPANECQVCNSALTQTAWSPRPNGTSCGVGGTCQGGTCLP
jgi:hypothetical protein